MIGTVMYCNTPMYPICSTSIYYFALYSYLHAAIHIADKTYQARRRHWSEADSELGSFLLR